MAALAAVSLQTLPSVPERAARHLAGVTLILVAAIGIRPFVLDYPQAPWLHYPGRVLLVVVPAVLSVVGARVCAGPLLPWARQRALAFQLAALVIAISAWHVDSILEWRSYLARFRAELAGQRGVVAFEATTLAAIPFRAYGWEWTQPTVSVLLQTMDGRPVTTVITNPVGAQGQPFDPNAPAQMPDLSAFTRAAPAPR
jgi:hypothetical protein